MSTIAYRFAVSLKLTVLLFIYHRRRIMLTSVLAKRIAAEYDRIPVSIALPCIIFELFKVK